MLQADVYVDGQFAGLLTEWSKTRYTFEYDVAYQSAPVSLTMPLTQRKYEYSRFPAFFDGLLPEGMRLDILLKQKKLDGDDYLKQLIAVGANSVGNVTIQEHKL